MNALSSCVVKIQKRKIGAGCDVRWSGGTSLNSLRRLLKIQIRYTLSELVFHYRSIGLCAQWRNQEFLSNGQKLLEAQNFNGQGWSKIGQSVSFENILLGKNDLQKFWMGSCPFAPPWLRHWKWCTCSHIFYLFYISSTLSYFHFNRTFLLFIN